MKIVAIAEKGREFIYITRTAHKVNAAKAARIVELLNAAKYKLPDAEKTTWFIYDVDRYDNAFYYAEGQSFTLGKRGLIEYH